MKVESLRREVAKLKSEKARLYGKLEASYRSLDQSKTEIEAYSKALDDELEKGRQIQKDFLPRQIPNLSNWEIATYFAPAKQVSGDFYDVFSLPGNYLGIVIADVCDKGVGSALYMALIRRQIQMEPGDILLGFTDGITEAPAPSGELFTRKRLVEIFGQSYSSAGELLERIKMNLFGHIQNASLSDDITMVAVQRLRFDQA